MSKSNTSKEMRQDPLFLRNDFLMTGKYKMPIVKICNVDISTVSLIGADETKKNDLSLNIYRTVHFFVDDYKLEKYYNQPHNHIERLAQYPHILTPDYSLYTDMPIALQIYNTFRNRWCGAYWQEKGLSVIPTISWGAEESYDFCFDGLECGTVVAVSTLGATEEKELFLKGYYEMKKRIAPKQVLWFGKAFPEADDEVINVDYFETKRRKI